MADLQDISRNWATRPGDERLKSLDELQAVTLAAKSIARVGEAKLRDLRVNATDSGLMLTGKAGIPVAPSNYAFGQLCRYAGAPAGFLGELPVKLAADVLNDRLTAACGQRVEASGLENPSGRSGTVGDRDVRLLMAINGERTLRGINSPMYARIWDSDIVGRIRDIGGDWTNPQCYAWDAEAGRPKWGGEMEPGGLYRGDRDMAILLTSQEHSIEPTPGRRMNRFVMLGNSEVGARSFWMKAGYYDMICGNLIVWGATDVVETRIRHVGTAPEKAWAELALTFGDWANAATKQDEIALRAARDILLGNSEDEVIKQTVKITALPQKTVKGAFQMASEFADVDGNASSVWGMVSGLTRYSQSMFSQYADLRTDVDIAAGQLLRVTVQRN